MHKKLLKTQTNTPLSVKKERNKKMARKLEKIGRRDRKEKKKVDLELLLRELKSTVHKNNAEFYAKFHLMKKEPVHKHQKISRYQ